MRFDDYLCLRTYHDGLWLKQLEQLMLFNVAQDPHEENDLAEEMPEVADNAMGKLADWEHEMKLTSMQNVDPMMTVLREGGPFHTRGCLPEYIKRLNTTGRRHHAENLAARHPGEI